MIDPIVEQVRAEFHARSQVGIAKYGTTLEQNNAPLIDRVQHLKEELMDATLYCQWLINQVKSFSDDGK